MSMFGIIIAGRLVQTDFQKIQPLDETKLVINISNADAINHVVVFMTGLQPFPEGMAGSVYFSWPNGSASPSWQYLGYISNDKPSSIYKISKLKSDLVSSHPFSAQQAVSHVAQIGISIEPLVQVQLMSTNLLEASTVSASTVDSFTEFVNKMLENFVNYISSFALTQAQMQPNPTESYVPLGNVQQWFTNFQRRFQQNSKFWKS